MPDFFPQAASGQPGQGHEPNTLVVKGIVLFAIGLVVVGIVVEYCLSFIMRDFTREEATLKALAPPLLSDKSATFPAPQLQPEPPVDLVKFKADELARLNGYGWVDQKAGIAHIPIDRALEIVAKKGLPSSNVPAEKSAAVAADAAKGGADAKDAGKP
jgi:hypothetical protein